MALILALARANVATTAATAAPATAAPATAAAALAVAILLCPVLGRALGQGATTAATTAATATAPNAVLHGVAGRRLGGRGRCKRGRCQDHQPSGAVQRAGQQSRCLPGLAAASFFATGALAAITVGSSFSFSSSRANGFDIAVRWPPYQGVRIADRPIQRVCQGRTLDVFNVEMASTTVCQPWLLPFALIRAPAYWSCTSSCC